LAEEAQGEFMGGGRIPDKEPVPQVPAGQELGPKPLHQAPGCQGKKKNGQKYFG
jgi:hypothetical protein